MKLENKVTLERVSKQEKEILKRKIFEFYHEATIFQCFEHEKKRVYKANKHNFLPLKHRLEELIKLNINQSHWAFLRGKTLFDLANDEIREYLHEKEILKYIDE